MEKDNKKLRDDSRREYNDTIRVSMLYKHPGYMLISTSLLLNLSVNAILDTKSTKRRRSD